MPAPADENPGAVSKIALLAPFFDELPGSGGVRYRLLATPMVGELLPDIEYHELEGAGHLAHYEFPDRINPLLIQFLSN